MGERIKRGKRQEVHKKLREAKVQRPDERQSRERQDTRAAWHSKDDP
jgi:hypothetical protein